MSGFRRILCLAIATGCLAALAAVAARAQEPALVDPSTLPVEDPVETLAKEIEQAVAMRSPKKYASYYDFDGLFRISTRLIDIAPGMTLRVRNAFDDACKGFVQNMVQSLDPGGDYRFLRIIPTDEGPRLLFRMTNSNGLNYHQLLIGRNSMGDIRIIDVDIMANGEMLSQIIQRILHQAVIRAGHADALPLPHREMMDQLAKMNKLLQEDKPREALEVYESMPEIARGDRLARLMRVHASVLIDDAERTKALDEYHASFKGDPTPELFMVNVLIERQEFDQAMEAINRLDQELGGDPYLDVFRSTVAMARGDVPLAKSLAQRAAEGAPQVSAAHNQLLVLSLREQDHVEALRLMRLLRDQFKMEFVDLNRIPEFAEFTKSPQYQEWIGVSSTRPTAPTTSPAGPKFRF